jgi:hypothetical protein
LLVCRPAFAAVVQTSGELPSRHRARPTRDDARRARPRYPRSPETRPDPDQTLDNLVVAHGPCNREKRDHLAAAEQVERWAERMERQAAELGAVATATRWRREPERTLGVARSIYLRLPARRARLRHALGAGRGAGPRPHGFRGRRSGAERERRTRSQSKIPSLALEEASRLPLSQIPSPPPLRRNFCKGLPLPEGGRPKPSRRLRLRSLSSWPASCSIRPSSVRGRRR